MQAGQVPEYFASSTRRHFGELGREWIGTIPNLIERYASAWNLTVHAPFEDLSFNYVLPVTRADGSQAVLKLGVPEPEQRSEILALRHYDGRGIVRQLEYDLDDQVSLTERLIPGRMLSEMFPAQDDKATEIAASVLRELALPAPEDIEGFTSLAGWARGGMSKLREKFDGGSGPFPSELVDRAERLFDELLTTTTAPALLHGDFHHMNVLYSDQRGWLAIDPKGVIGDFAFDCAAFLLNPIPDIRSVPDYRWITKRRIDVLTEVTGLDRQRVLGWAQAFAVLSAWWDYDEIGSWKPTIALGEQLAALNDR